jgi:hypothetical protein
MDFTLGPSADLHRLATIAGIGAISSSSCIVRFFQGGEVEVFRCGGLFLRKQNGYVQTFVSISIAIQG